MGWRCCDGGGVCGCGGRRRSVIHRRGITRHALHVPGAGAVGVGGPQGGEGGTRVRSGVHGGGGVDEMGGRSTRGGRLSVGGVRGLREAGGSAFVPGGWAGWRVLRRAMAAREHVGIGVVHWVLTRAHSQTLHRGESCQGAMNGLMRWC